MLELVTIGETMVAFMPTEKGAIRYAHTMTKKTAGAESNVAIGLSKLGKKTGWISKLGEDEFGEYILRELRGEGVDTSAVISSPCHPTGIMFKQFSAGNETSVFYYRKNSAASTMAEAEIPMDYISRAKILHLSGITPALSDSCRRMIPDVVRQAKALGVKICFDPNIRLKLWSREEARQCLTELLPLADIVLIGDEEAALLLDETEPEAVIERLRALNISKIALKLGAQGAIVADESTMVTIDAVPVEVVDNIGAGDAFNAGFLCGLLEEKDIELCGKMGAVMGAMAVSSYGDVEGLPNRKQLDHVLNKEVAVYR